MVGKKKLRWGTGTRHKTSCDTVATKQKSRGLEKWRHSQEGMVRAEKGEQEEVKRMLQKV